MNRKIRSRVAEISFLMALAATVASADESCVDVNDGNRAFCNLLRFCETLSDQEAKRECISLAEEMRPDPGSEAVVQPSRADVEESAAAERSSDPVSEPIPTEPDRLDPATEVVAEPTVEVAPVDESHEEVKVLQETVQALPVQSSRSGNDQREVHAAEQRESQGTEEDGRLSVANAWDRLVNKNRFEAALLYYQPSGFKSGLIVLSNGLVFKVDYSAAFKPELGEMIFARKRSRLTNTNYNIVGGRGGAIMASRQRCNYPDQSVDTRKYCAIGQQVLDEKLVD